MIYGYWEETVGVEAGKLAVRIVNHAVKAEGFDFLVELERLIARRAARVRTLHPGDHRRGGVA